MSDGRSRGWVTPVLWAALAVMLIVLPAFIETYWAQLGALSFAVAIGAIGLMLVFGRLGQLSLAHSFFLAIGAYSYVWLASPADDSLLGVGLPGIVALPVAVAITAAAGLILSPMAARLKGLSLGLATIPLVFIGVWLLHTVEDLTGGYNGRTVPPLTVGPLSSAGSTVAIAGMQVTSARFLWYAGLLALVLVSVFVHSTLRGRVGRAMTAIRDADVHAGALGVHVAQVRGIGFTLSSALAGLGGVLLAVNIQRLVPEYWGFALSLSYLAMIVIGGMHSVGGAVVGAVFVTALPAVLQRFGGNIPGIGAEGGGGLGPAVTAQVVYGLAVILVLLFEPDGLWPRVRRSIAKARSLGRARP